MKLMRVIQKLSLTLIVAVAPNFFTPSASAATSCQRPKGNPYECPFSITDGGNDVWIGVRDQSSPYYYQSNPMYIGKEFGGPVPCQRFSLYFYKHRSQLSQISCGIGYYGINPSSPSAYIYVKIGSGVFQYPPADSNRLDYLELSGGPYWQTHARAERELANCNKTLEFAKAYEAACPR